VRIRHILLILGGVGLVAGLAVTACFTRDWWRPWLTSPQPQAEGKGGGLPAKLELTSAKISPQARSNLGLVTKPVQVRKDYRRTIQLPGMVVDRPGHSDRGVTAPAVAVVKKVHILPGDTVRPGDKLFTLRLISEYLQNSQSELFKTTREAQLVREQRDRLEGPARSGFVSEAKLIELDYQLKKLNAAIQSHRQDLLTRGLTPSQIDGVAEGTFAAEVEVVAPRPHACSWPPRRPRGTARRWPTRCRS
jgi:membrane fusion protein, heavy metal efflux system